MSKTLYVVATPIGNLKDITFRAVEVLKTVDYIACEDTRETLKLLLNYGIENKQLIVYNDYNENIVADRIVDLLKNHDVALVSDAGTPSISDPGYRVVKKAIENGIKVVPIPGPFAGITALSVSGLPTDKFLFVGFLPNKKNQKREDLEYYLSLNITLIVYESPKRVIDTLKLIEEINSNVNVVIAKELTKIHEEFIRGNSSEILAYFSKNPDKIKGEFVILIEPVGEKELDYEKIKEKIKTLKNKNLSTKEIAQILATEFKISKSKAYKLVLDF